MHTKIPATKDRAIFLFKKQLAPFGASKTTAGYENSLNVAGCFSNGAFYFFRNNTNG